MRWGSPPHTWRIPKKRAGEGISGRITSTYVENTNASDYFDWPSRDHLHIRGEYQEIGLCFLHNPGSPPHTWRIQYGGNTIDNINGITSTYVENTGSSSAYVRLYEDHLHIRGEYDISKRHYGGLSGSPPHTWRIQKWRKNNLKSTRITSTYVENTVILTETKILERDHLHIRGEYWFCRNKVIQDLGSPPHTWRIQYLLPSSPNGKGITSTYVENTVKMKPNTRILEDHLHIRGEYFTIFGVFNSFLGSPPHTWRILLQAIMPYAAARITSTYVENTRRIKCNSYCQ